MVIVSLLLLLSLILLGIKKERAKKWSWIALFASLGMSVWLLIYHATSTLTIKL